MEGSLTEYLEAKLEQKGHHCWCNGQRGPVVGCRWCDPKRDGGLSGLWGAYDYSNTEEMVSLMAKHFPKNVRRT